MEEELNLLAMSGCIYHEVVLLLSLSFVRESGCSMLTWVELSYLHFQKVFIQHNPISEESDGFAPRARASIIKSATIFSNGQTCFNMCYTVVYLDSLDHGPQGKTKLPSTESICQAPK